MRNAVKKLGKELWKNLLESMALMNGSNLYLR